MSYKMRSLRVEEITCWWYYINIDGCEDQTETHITIHRLDTDLTSNSRGLIISFRWSLKCFFLSFNIALAFQELPIYNPLWETVCGHPDNMTNPLKLLSDDTNLNASAAGMLENIDMRYSISPWQFENALKSADVEGFKNSYVSFIWSPRFSDTEGWISI